MEGYKEGLLNKLYADISSTITKDDIEDVYQRIYNDVYGKVMQRIQEGGPVFNRQIVDDFSRSINQSIKHVEQPTQEQPTYEDVPAQESEPVKESEQVQESEPIQENNTDVDYDKIVEEYPELVESGMIGQNQIDQMKANKYPEDKVRAYLDTMKKRFEDGNSTT